jgi:Transposase DDE domain group 1
LVIEADSRDFSWATPAMNDPMLPLPGLSSVSDKPVVVKFDGGLLSSDGGILALREVEQRLRIADRLAACMVDPRAPDQITHSLADIIRFRLLMISAGYEDGNDANSLRSDPMFKMALDLSPSDRELCSQSTISRLENLPDVRALLRMGRAMVDLYCESFAKVPKRITLDIDDTFDAVHGGQQLRLFNAHYDEYGFQPIVVFDGEGRFVTAVLRPAKRPSGKEIRRARAACIIASAKSSGAGHVGGQDRVNCRRKAMGVLPVQRRNPDHVCEEAREGADLAPARVGRRTLPIAKLSRKSNVTGRRESRP